MSLVACLVRAIVRARRCPRTYTMRTLFNGDVVLRCKLGRRHHGDCRYEYLGHRFHL